jgi:hypothetical protein
MRSGRARVQRSTLPWVTEVKYLRGMQLERVFAMKFASVYPLSVTKATKKGRSQAEVDQVIRWLDKLIDELAKGRSMEKILRA